MWLALLLLAAWIGEGGETWKWNQVGRSWAVPDRGLKHTCLLFFPGPGSLPPTEEQMEPSRGATPEDAPNSDNSKAEPRGTAARWL